LNVQEASSNGWMSFFLVNLSQNGRLSVLRSATASLRICDVLWPVTKSVVFGFSFCCGSRFAMARFARAFLGFLVNVSALCYDFTSYTSIHAHLFQHVDVLVVCWRCRTLGGNFFLRIDSGPANGLADLIKHGGDFRVGGVLLLDSFRSSAGQSW
jgi:hypothetical protein